MRLGIFAYADTVAVPWGGFFEVPFLGGDNYSPVQAVRYRRILIKIYKNIQYKKQTDENRSVIFALAENQTLR